MLTVAPSGLAQSAPAASPASEIAERVHRDGGYASELPIDADGLDGPLDRPTPSTTTPRPRAPRGGGSSPTLAYLILGVVLAALVVLFTMLLVRFRPAVAGGTKGVERGPRPSEPTPFPLIVPVTGDPDALAAEGRFEEALAALLWRALTTVGWEPHGQARA
ncbi:MAG: hypothetical protein RIF41_08035, partial [Polyangiaceae bacterium]